MMQMLCMKLELMLYKEVCLGRFLQSLVSILYPPVCPMCGRVVQGTGGRSVACRDCRRSLVYVGQNHCMKCGKPLDEENRELCFDLSLIHI